MQSVVDAFSVEATDTVRYVTQSTKVAWKKDYQPGITFFTIGVSRIGGTDIIPGSQGVQSEWNKYSYQDETSNTLNISVEKGLNLPLGGITKSLANVRLDNTSGRYTPRYLGGQSELFTAILPRRPITISSGFVVDGVDYNLPQFVGVLDKMPKLNVASKQVDLSAVDFIDYLQDKFIDHSAMFTNQRSDEVIENILTQLGFATSQYELDAGINRIGFGLFETGTKFANIIDQIVKAEYGHFYQDEEGRLRFENRQHWTKYPYNNVQRVITTAQVLNAGVPSEDHIINVVEIKGSPRSVQDLQLVWQATGYGGVVQELAASGDTEIWINYNDPMFEIDTPVPNGTAGQTSYYVANSQNDGNGSDLTASVSLKRIDNFAQASKLTFTNTSSTIAYLSTLDIWGRPARKTGDIYYRNSYDSSITAFEERPISIENDYIQSLSQAETIANMILEDFSQPENLLELRIRALPELQLGDLVSWQGRYWRIYDIKSTIDSSSGYVQDLKMVQRTIKTYFTIGVSRIGGEDVISP